MDQLRIMNLEPSCSMPALWETGGGVGDTGQAVLIADKDFQRKKSLYVIPNLGKGYNEGHFWGLKTRELAKIRQFTDYDYVRSWHEEVLKRQRALIPVAVGDIIGEFERYKLIDGGGCNRPANTGKLRQFYQLAAELELTVRISRIAKIASGEAHVKPLCVYESGEWDEAPPEEALDFLGAGREKTCCYCCIHAHFVHPQKEVENIYLPK